MIQRIVILALLWATAGTMGLSFSTASSFPMATPDIPMPEPGGKTTVTVRYQIKNDRSCEVQERRYVYEVRSSY